MPPPGPPPLPEGGKTLVYHSVDGHDVKLDYYAPPQSNGSLPVVIHWHGGGMTAGSRQGDLPRWLYGIFPSIIMRFQVIAAYTLYRRLPGKGVHLYLTRLPPLPSLHYPRPN